MAFTEETGWAMLPRSVFTARVHGGLEHVRGEHYPSRATLSDAPEPVASFGRGQHAEGVWDLSNDGAWVYAVLSGGAVELRAAAVTAVLAESALAVARGWFAPFENTEEGMVGVSFWTYGAHGPISMHRMISVPTWAEVEENYSASARDSLARLMALERWDLNGNLVLWSGEPGTGKTYALRALARAWRDWCEVHYIVDPDSFFGAHADYMMQVLLGDDSPVSKDGDDSPEAKWKLLVLEDSGELLSADARERVGQALGRLLNTVDGLIGQGLRVLVLITTNEDVGRMHPAITRPGRRASGTEFGALSASEAREWLERADVPVPADLGCATLADLFAVAAGEALREPVSTGFG